MLNPRICKNISKLALASRIKPNTSHLFHENEITLYIPNTNPTLFPKPALHDSKRKYSTEIYKNLLDKQKNSELKPVDLWKLDVEDLLPSDQIIDNFLTSIENKLTKDQILQITTGYLKLHNSTESDGEELIKSYRNDWESSLQTVCKSDYQLITRLANILFQTVQEKSLSMELYQYARKMGDNDAAFSLASIKYLGSGGVEKDPEYSKKELYALSKKGHPYAQLNYATILIKEDPVKYKAQIEELLTLACKYGLARAHLKLGELYKNGKVLDKNFELAKKHLELAVSKDMHEAIFLLGDMYSKGEGLVNNQPDYAQAFEHFKDAASKGVVEAQYNLGVYYLNGFGVEKNVDLAVEYWEMASMQGFPLAALNLAKLYMEGLQADSESKANPDGTTTINPSKRIGFKAPLFEKDYVKAKNYIYAAKSLGKGTFIEQDANNLLQKLAVRSGDSKIPTERIARAGTATDINANANVNTKGNTNSSISATRASKGYKVVEKKSSGGKCSVM